MHTLPCALQVNAEQRTQLLHRVGQGAGLCVCVNVSVYVYVYLCVCVCA